MFPQDDAENELFFESHDPDSPLISQETLLEAIRDGKPLPANACDFDAVLVAVRDAGLANVPLLPMLAQLVYAAAQTTSRQKDENARLADELAVAHANLDQARAELLELKRQLVKRELAAFEQTCPNCTGESQEGKD